MPSLCSCPPLPAALRTTSSSGPDCCPQHFVLFVSLSQALTSLLTRAAGRAQTCREGLEDGNVLLGLNLLENVLYCGDQSCKWKGRAEPLLELCSLLWDSSSTCTTSGDIPTCTLVSHAAGCDQLLRGFVKALLPLIALVLGFIVFAVNLLAAAQPASCSFPGSRRHGSLSSLQSQPGTEHLLSQGEPPGTGLQM